MKRSPKAFRRIDNLGRVVIPANLRSILDFNYGDDMTFELRDGGVLIRKPSDKCPACGSKLCA